MRMPISVLIATLLLISVISIGGKFSSKPIKTLTKFWIHEETMKISDVRYESPTSTWDERNRSTGKYFSLYKEKLLEFFERRVFDDFSLRYAENRRIK